jgi:hypothetical protein
MPGGRSTNQSGDEVVYIGGATVRKMAASDFEANGVKGGKDLVWDASNHKRISVEDLNSGMVDFLVGNHPREFVVAKAGKPAALPVDQPNRDAPNGE